MDGYAVDDLVDPIGSDGPFSDVLVLYFAESEGWDLFETLEQHLASASSQVYLLSPASKIFLS